jgi:SOS-response transcriptional repressor LexA
LGGKAFDVDHAMPFSFWRNNDLWNLFPATPIINANKSDKLPSYKQLNGSRDIIIDYWRGLDGAMGERFEREAQTLLGREPFLKARWESLLFSRFVEAFELTANQRGAERWQWDGLEDPPSSASIHRMAPSPVRYPEAEERILMETPPETKVEIIDFSELSGGAFTTHLPVIGALAAGSAFHGLETGSLDDLDGMGWVAVHVRHVRKNRFVVRVAGDSMQPTLMRGQFAIFEYHRTPRADRQIVIANIPEFGPDHSGTEAIKRITQDAGSWIFESDNPSHPPFSVSKSLTTYPILGTFVDVL